MRVFKLHRTEVAQGLIPALPIVEHLGKEKMSTTVFGFMHVVSLPATKAPDVLASH
jgi:hypothetical protein